MRLNGSGTTTSVWMEAPPAPRRRRLARYSETDVCVVGGGLAGVTTAYLLARAGRRVTLLEDRFVGGGETSRTTAHLTSAMDDRIYKMERWHGRDGVRQIVQAHQGAIDRVAEVQARERIACGFARVPGFLFLQDGDRPSLLEKEEKAARRAGLQVRFETETRVGGFDAGPGLRFEGQGMFHPMRYLRGLATAVGRHGGRIHEGVRVVEVKETDLGVDVRTADGAVVAAQDVVIATNSPITDVVSIHTKQAPYRTYAMAFDLGDEDVAPGLYWDTGWPYHYIRTFEERGRRLLIVGGEDHRTGLKEDTTEPHGVLEAWVRERWPGLGAATHRWSGQVLEPVDGAAFIGSDPARGDHVYVITGDSGQGMTHTTLGAHILADLVLGRDNPFAEAFEASRKVRPVSEYLGENVLTNAQFLRLLQPVGGGAVESIPVGEGRVLQRRGRPVAVYRSGPRSFHALSANCRHLGCPVSWNTLEKTWDCRCHGSRYAPSGEPLNPPAHEPLQPWQAPIGRRRARGAAAGEAEEADETPPRAEERRGRKPRRGRAPTAERTSGRPAGRTGRSGRGPRSEPADRADGRRGRRGPDQS